MLHVLARALADSLSLHIYISCFSEPSNIAFNRAELVKTTSVAIAMTLHAISGLDFSYFRNKLFPIYIDKNCYLVIG